MFAGCDAFLSGREGDCCKVGPEEEALCGFRGWIFDFCTLDKKLRELLPLEGAPHGAPDPSQQTIIPEPCKRKVQSLRALSGLHFIGFEFRVWGVGV